MTGSTSSSVTPLGEYRRNGQSFPLEDVTLGTPLEGVRFFNVMAGFVEPDTDSRPRPPPDVAAQGNGVCHR